jgi:hypothetical protein
VACIAEKGIIADFSIESDGYKVVTFDIVAPEATWQEYAIQARDQLEENVRTLSFDRSGKQVAQREDPYHPVDDSDKAVVEELLAKSQPVEALEGRTISSKIVLHEEKNWIAYWESDHVFVHDSRTGERLFARHANIEHVFFEGDRIGMIVYNIERHQEESDHDWCGRTDYKVDDKTLSNFRVLYFSIDGILQNVVELNDPTEKYSHDRAKEEYSKRIGVWGHMLARHEPDNTLSFEDMRTKERVVSHKNFRCLESNGYYLVSTDHKVFSLVTGQEVDPQIPQPWVAAKLSGNFLAVAKATNEVCIVNLKSGEMKFQANTPDVPERIAGFRFKKDEEAFVAVQSRGNIKVWYQA